MKKTLWIFSELYFPETTSTGYFLTRIAEGLVGRFRVKVVCSQPTYSARGSRAQARELRNGVEIFRCRGTTLNKNFLFFRLINAISISFFLMVEAFRRIRQGELVLAVTNPPLLAPILRLFCGLRKARMVLLIHDVYPEAIVMAGFCQRESIAFHIFDLFSRRSLRAMDGIIVLGRDMAKLVREKLRFASTPPLAIIPHWGDPAMVANSGDLESSLRQRYGLEGKFVVQYCGNMGRTHGLDTLGKAISLLKKEDQIVFLLIGWGAGKEKLSKFLQEEGVENAILLPPVTPEEFGAFQALADVAIISLAKGMAGVSVPSRLYNVLLAGKPIIAVADSDSELAMVVSEAGAGWVVAPGAPGLLAEKILSLFVNLGEIRKCGLAARKEALSKYSFERVIEGYSRFLTAIPGTRTTRSITKKNWQDEVTGRPIRE